MTDVELVIVNYKNALDHGVEWNWMNSFMEDYQQTKDVTSAIVFANREWDV